MSPNLYRKDLTRQYFGILGRVSEKSMTPAANPTFEKSAVPEHNIGRAQNEIGAEQSDTPASSENIETEPASPIVAAKPAMVPTVTDRETGETMVENVPEMLEQSAARRQLEAQGSSPLFM